MRSGIEERETEAERIRGELIREEMEVTERG